MEPDFLASMMQSTCASSVQVEPSTVAHGYDVVGVAKDKSLISSQSMLVGGPGATLVDCGEVINDGTRYLSTKAGTAERVPGDVALQRRFIPACPIGCG